MPFRAMLVTVGSCILANSPKEKDHPRSGFRELCFGRVGAIRQNCATNPFVRHIQGEGMAFHEQLIDGTDTSLEDNQRGVLNGCEIHCLRRLGATALGSVLSRS